VLESLDASGVTITSFFEPLGFVAWFQAVLLLSPTYHFLA
jgi:hypothetical protein